MTDIPPRFGEYRVEERLGTGAFAEVFVVTHEGLGGFRRSYAVKAIREDLASDRSIVSLFEEEARVGGKLSHANIVQIREPGREGRRVYIVKELVQGLDLARLLAAAVGGLPVPHAVSITIELLKALEYAHTRQLYQNGRAVDAQVLHRDLCPRNVLLSRQGEVKLTNFGVPAPRDAHPPYVAPEILRGGSGDPAADLFSCGVVLYEMLTGRHPFLRSTAARTREAVLQAEYAPLRQVDPDLDEALQSVVERALSATPGRRLQSATAMKEALDAYLRDAGFVSTPGSLARYLADVAPPPAPQELDAEEDDLAIDVDDDRTNANMGPIVAPTLRPRPRPRPRPLSTAQRGARLLDDMGRLPAPRRQRDTEESTLIRSRSSLDLGDPDDWNDAPTRLHDTRGGLDDLGDLELPAPEEEAPAGPAPPAPPPPRQPSPASPAIHGTAPSRVAPLPPAAPPVGANQRWLWVVSGGAVALVVMMVGFFLGARAAQLRAARSVAPVTVVAPAQSTWTRNGAAVQGSPRADGTTAVRAASGTTDLAATAPDGVRVRVRIGPGGVQQVVLERAPEEDP